MGKGVSAAVKRNRIANYMDSLPESFEVLEDMLGENNPSIKLETKSRIIDLSCDEIGHVHEEFSMRPGEGSKEEFLTKQEAYNAITNYYNDYYTGAKIIKKSFDEGILKIDLENRYVTLSYDSINKSVEEKDRAHKPAKPLFEQMELPIPQMESSEPPKKKSSTKRKAKRDNVAADEKKDDSSEYEQMTLFDMSVFTEEKTYEKWADGTMVKNICDGKQYRVKKDNGNSIEVFDPEHGYLIMARADLKIVEIRE